MESRPTDNEFVFYDGPPFANGLPHYGHLLTGYVKDVVPRYRTMRGQRVERRFGWDCHGLPAETEAEKELGVSGRGPITEFGIDRFNEHCRTSVLRYTKEWERYVTRQARWVDFANDYKTMDLSYMESVMWAIKQLWDKGLLYEDYRVLPYCWECETPLSNSETRQDDAYRDRQDPAVTVAFTLEPGGRTRRRELVAGTRAGLGVDDDARGRCRRTWPWRSARTCRTPSSSGTGPASCSVRPSSPATRSSWRGPPGRHGDRPGSGRPALPAAVPVLRGDAQRLRGPRPRTSSPPRKAPGSCTWRPVSARTTRSPAPPRASRWSARSTTGAGSPPEVPDFEGLQVFEANQPVIRALRQQGTLVRSDSYVHAYPHCWRTDTPLVYRAVTSWFVKVTAIKDRLLARNQEITWVPEHVRDGSFGKWLANARDWSISRNRFWGSPIPVWKSDDPRYPRIDVYGSLDELERDFGVRPDRPAPARPSTS